VLPVYGENFLFLCLTYNVLLEVWNADAIKCAFLSYEKKVHRINNRLPGNLGKEGYYGKIL